MSSGVRLGSTAFLIEIMPTETQAVRASLMIIFLKDETGLELSEYAVAAALVAVTVVVTFQTLGDVITTKIEALASRVSG
jgi:pilus assembly protein Flp/PilA